MTISVIAAAVAIAIFAAVGIVALGDKKSVDKEKN